MLIERYTSLKTHRAVAVYSTIMLYIRCNKRKSEEMEVPYI